ncbi:hypothetical protein VTK26DRAFT_7061 [Humicola hyalothermophila]
MPRRSTNFIDDPQITLRLKHGIHTIFLFVMLDWTFSQVTTELLSILRDRYPRGLTTCIAPPKTTAIPASDSDVKVAYALAKDPSDLSHGWKGLNIQPTDTVGGKGLVDMCPVAFALLDPDADESKVQFQVEVASLDDEQ